MLQGALEALRPKPFFRDGDTRLQAESPMDPLCCTQQRSGEPCEDTWLVAHWCVHRICGCGASVGKPTTQRPRVPSILWEADRLELQKIVSGECSVTNGEDIPTPVNKISFHPRCGKVEEGCFHAGQSCLARILFSERVILKIGFST